MNRIEIDAANKRITVTVHGPRHQPAEAVLLGHSGEERQRFVLREGANQLSLQQHPAGTYALRIEAGNKVSVRQVVLNP